MIKPNEFVRDIIPYMPGKPVEELERELGIKDAIKIASNENPLGPSPLALRAVSEALSKLNRYPDGDAFYLKRKLADRLSVNPENLIFGNGSNEVNEIVARTFMKPGDEAIMGEFAFIVFPIVTQAVGAKAIISPMPDLIHNLRDMFERITPKTKAVFIANPNNPTGTMVRRGEVEWFLERVPEDIIVVIDEAYFDYVDNPDYPNSLDYQNLGKSIITVRTFSKIYGLAGLRLGFGVSSKEIISYMNRVREPFNVNSLAQVAAMSALDDKEHVERSRKINREGLDYLSRELTELNLPFAPSFTNFILVDLGSDPIPVYNALLKEGVIVRPVGGYGLKTHLRVTVGLPEENERFIRAIKKVFGK
ncbi:MAG TPA: histidinol-phosphate transaminase [Thermodesulfobacteriota bacterium]|nr:histidinol-phosphate transaminase [Thermodesulfobacteriota bacterium]